MWVSSQITSEMPALGLGLAMVPLITTSVCHLIRSGMGLISTSSPSVKPAEPVQTNSSYRGLRLNQNNRSLSIDFMCLSDETQEDSESPLDVPLLVQTEGETLQDSESPLDVPPLVQTEEETQQDCESPPDVPPLAHSEEETQQDCESPPDVPPLAHSEEETQQDSESPPNVPPLAHSEEETQQDSESPPDVPPLAHSEEETQQDSSSAHISPVTRHFGMARKRHLRALCINPDISGPRAERAWESITDEPDSPQPAERGFRIATVCSTAQGKLEAVCSMIRAGVLTCITRLIDTSQMILAFAGLTLSAPFAMIRAAFSQTREGLANLTEPKPVLPPLKKALLGFQGQQRKMWVFFPKKEKQLFLVFPQPQQIFHYVFPKTEVEMLLDFTGPAQGMLGIFPQSTFKLRMSFPESFEDVLLIFPKSDQALLVSYPGPTVRTFDWKNYGGFVQNVFTKYPCFLQDFSRRNPSYIYHRIPLRKSFSCLSHGKRRRGCFKCQYFWIRAEKSN